MLQGNRGSYKSKSPRPKIIEKTRSLTGDIAACQMCCELAQHHGPSLSRLTSIHVVWGRVPQKASNTMHLTRELARSGGIVLLGSIACSVLSGGAIALDEPTAPGSTRIESRVGDEDGAAILRGSTPSRRAPARLSMPTEVTLRSLVAAELLIAMQASPPSRFTYRSVRRGNGYYANPAPRPAATQTTSAASSRPRTVGHGARNWVDGQQVAVAQALDAGERLTVSQGLSTRVVGTFDPLYYPERTKDMKPAARIWIGAALLCGVGYPAAMGADAGDWKAQHDAGWKAYKEDRLDEAKKDLRAAEKAARAFGPDDPRLALTLDHLAWVLSAEGETKEAETLAKAALAIREKKLGAGHPDVAASLNTLACLYDQAGRTAEARPLYARCLEVAEKALGPNDPSVAAALDNLATADHLLGRLAMAEAEYRRALALREKAADARPADLAPTLHCLGVFLYRPEKVCRGRNLAEESNGHPGEGPRPRAPRRCNDARDVGLDVRTPGQARGGRALPEEGAGHLLRSTWATIIRTWPDVP